MLIHEMTHEECIRALVRLRFGRLGCAHDNQPYVVPLYFAHHDRHLYTFSTVGQKIEWMRENPRVCVEADEITSHSQWLCVVASGRYEELPDTPEYKFERDLAYEMLRERAMWWQPAKVASSGDGAADSLIPFYYRIRIDRVTGHRAMPDSAEAAALAAPKAITKSKSWLSSLLRRARVKSHPWMRSN